MDKPLKINEILDLISQIEQQPVICFSNLLPSMLPNNKGGVYLILSNRTLDVLYVGRTSNLQQRLYTNHLMGNLSTARLKKYLIDDPNLPDINNLTDAKVYIQNKCCFKYIEITDSLTRGRVEGLFSYFFETKYIEKEH